MEEKKINEDVLCILKYSNDEIILDYITIDSYFLPEFNALKKLCHVNFDNLNEIIKYIINNDNLKKIEKYYRYCKRLDGTYQAFRVKYDDYEKLLIEKKALIHFNEENSENYDVHQAFFNLQNEIVRDFELYTAAFNIEKAYEKCKAGTTVLTYSHRINGWSEPVYQLSDNFTIELKTNFGYGSSSYFFIKIKYKNIDITPVSEWVDYEIAKFSEIVRYTKSFARRELRGIFEGRNFYRKHIENWNWFEAIVYTRDACNCSLKSEADFVNKYIIDECERMTSGLEKILVNSDFVFIGELNSHYKVDKKGHQLVEFRGEKISGALDFIIKIVELEAIVEIKSFINRIESCNKKIQPHLAAELKIIAAKIDNLSADLEVITPNYLKLAAKNDGYSAIRSGIRSAFIKANRDKSLEIVDLNVGIIFTGRFPEYGEFSEEFASVKTQYQKLNQDLANYKKLQGNISAYDNKILSYFKVKSDNY